jgi:hypothetical protein
MISIIGLAADCIPPNLYMRPWINADKTVKIRSFRQFVVVYLLI